MSTIRGTEELAHELGALAADGLKALLHLMEFVHLSMIQGTDDRTSYPAKCVRVYEREGWTSVCRFQYSGSRRSDIAWGVPQDSAEPKSVRQPLDREC